jgi:hypothetical protein
MSRRSEAKYPKIVIEVSGGNVQAVYADRVVEARLVDWDNIKAGDPPPQKSTFEDGTNLKKCMTTAKFVC